MKWSRRRWVYYPLCRKKNSENWNFYCNFKLIEPITKRQCVDLLCLFFNRNYQPWTCFFNHDYLCFILRCTFCESSKFFDTLELSFTSLKCRPLSGSSFIFILECIWILIQLVIFRMITCSIITFIFFLYWAFGPTHVTPNYKKGQIFFCIIWGGERLVTSLCGLEVKGGTITLV